LPIAGVFSPTKTHAASFAAQFGCSVYDTPAAISPDNDLILLCIPDDRIAEVAKALTHHRAVIAHTSGNTSIKYLSENKRYGVFYPLQTFSKERKVDMKQVPVCLEASDAETMDLLQSLAGMISESVHVMNSRQRKYLHLAAVLVSNFTNHLYGLASDFLADREIDFELLKPLILESAKKAVDMDPQQAQTGPARRGDRDTIGKHLRLLEGDEDIKALYRLITEQIVKKYHE
jgi:predicted short-subunit dehydrogenase-like oxidoreductase (DUF2520 family)